MTPQIGSIYKWVGGKDDDMEDLDVAHYLVIEHDYDIVWICMELETGKISEYNFHSGNAHYWELIL